MAPALGGFRACRQTWLPVCLGETEALGRQQKLLACRPVVMADEENGVILAACVEGRV